MCVYEATVFRDNSALRTEQVNPDLLCIWIDNSMICEHVSCAVPMLFVQTRRASTILK